MARRLENVDARTVQEAGCSYGADLQRWPEEARRDAQALLDHSAEAGVLFDEARTLDQAIDQATIREDALLWPPGERDAALDRLRSGVEA